MAEQRAISSLSRHSRCVQFYERGTLGSLHHGIDAVSLRITMVRVFLYILLPLPRTPGQTCTDTPLLHLSGTRCHTKQRGLITVPPSQGEWNIRASTAAMRTVNPIRDIVDQIDFTKVNPALELIKLSIGGTPAAHMSGAIPAVFRCGIAWSLAARKQCYCAVLC